MLLTDKTCRFCLIEQKIEYGHKLEDISVKNHGDTLVQALKDVFGWQVKTSEPLTKICMECKATLLDVFIFVRKVKTNDRKWRKVWLQSSTDVVDLSSDDDSNEVPVSSVKHEPDFDIHDDTSILFNSSQYIKEEGETSESDSNDNDDDKLTIECDVDPMVTSTTQEESNGLKNEPDSPSQRKPGPALRVTPLTTSYHDWSTSDEESSDDTDDSDFEESSVETPVEPPAKPKSTEISHPTPVIPSTSTSTIFCKEEITKHGFNNLAEKMLAIKRNPNLTDDQMCKIFYGLKCHLCTDKDFDTLNALESHFKKEHDIHKISVKCCNIDIIKPIMVDHIKYHLGTQKSSLKSHLKRLETMQICDECGLLFPSESLLKSHIADVHKALHTTLRRRSFNSEAAAIFDITSGQFVSSRYQCDICERPFYYESQMKTHRVKHLSLEEQEKYKRYECHDCSMRFYYKSDIQKHIEVVHAKYRRMLNGKVTCLECNKVISSMKHLSVHKIRHWTNEECTKNLKYKCDICQKPFWHRSTMLKHRMCHGSLMKRRNSVDQRGIWTTNPQTYNCSQCDKVFGSSVRLNIHLRCHMTPEERYQLKKYECNKCNKRYWSNYNLNEHIKFKHLKIYDYVCDICKRPYCSKERLTHHICNSGRKVFTRGDKPQEKHECEFCNKVYNTTMKLKIHMYQWHLPGFLFECPRCKKGFNHTKALDKHNLKCQATNTS